MAIKPENQFRSSVHKYLPNEVHQEKMNNPYSSGTADDWYSGRKADLWIEYKYIPRVPQRGVIWLVNPDVKKPMMTKLQQDWLNGRHRQGRNIAVIIGCPKGGVILRDEEWDLEITAASFISRIVSRTDLACWIRNQVEE